MIRRGWPSSVSGAGTSVSRVTAKQRPTLTTT